MTSKNNESPEVLISRIFSAPPEKVMLGHGIHFVNCHSKLENALSDASQMNIELWDALSVRRIYEENPILPLDDLFHVGGQLQKLIRRAEATLHSPNTYFSFGSRDTLTEYIQEARHFRSYIINRIRRGQ